MKKIIIIVLCVICLGFGTYAIVSNTKKGDKKEDKIEDKKVETEETELLIDEDANTSNSSNQSSNSSTSSNSNSSGSSSNSSSSSSQSSDSSSSSSQSQTTTEPEVFEPEVSGDPTEPDTSSTGVIELPFVPAS